MMNKRTFVVILTSLAPAVLAQDTPSPTSTAVLYGLCGGSVWTGPTICPDGSHCQYLNQFWSQCLPGPESTTMPIPTPSPSMTLSGEEAGITPAL
ncbi:hypothetical protein CVT26_003777 [Gymnopilus dilepis]|uniref:CBM1 domain-containing protein n=1 Tax=Gymnopilus dilepis TaxID=231916 RepID=A0A409W1U4_9AGAR|nr:hypothetical protein CVT26_003777 [Gymnopilus dilepis]